jgi:hypothetical protein
MSSSVSPALPHPSHLLAASKLPIRPNGSPLEVYQLAVTPVFRALPEALTIPQAKW